MASTDGERFLFHEDATMFRQAVTFTAAETRFDARLIEKDYFCTILLQQLAHAAPSLAFKGGTCLAKIHSGFYRLSEDLDFSVPMPLNATRGERSRALRGTMGSRHELAKQLAGFSLASPLVGTNNSTQYNAAVTYTSLLDGHTEIIRVEISLREPLLAEAVYGAARTLLLDPTDGAPVLSPLAVRSLSRDEAIAEKLRAALSRLEPAIRDFYDVDHLVHVGGFDLAAESFLAMVRRKLSVPQTGAVNVSAARLTAVRAQVEPELRPVLRPADFAAFDLDRAFAAVTSVARALE